MINTVIISASRVSIPRMKCIKRAILGRGKVWLFTKKESYWELPGHIPTKVSRED